MRSFEPVEGKCLRHGGHGCAVLHVIPVGQTLATALNVANGSALMWPTRADIRVCPYRDR
jgi:hypothetical protein